jgi:hypothetical protein
VITGQLPVTSDGKDITPQRCPCRWRGTIRRMKKETAEIAENAEFAEKRNKPIFIVYIIHYSTV